MKTIIYVHPWEGSYNHAILKNIIEDLKSKNKKFQVIDLYEDNFNPVYSKEELRLYSTGEYLDPLIKGYQNKLKNSSELIFIFPIWWFDLPAILKGFLDKVLLPKFTYLEDKEGNWKPLLTNIKKVTVVTTAVYSKEGLQPSAIEEVFMNKTLKGIGIPKENMKWFHFSEVNRTTDKRRKEFLKKIPSII